MAKLQTQFRLGGLLVALAALCGCQGTHEVRQTTITVLRIDTAVEPGPWTDQHITVHEGHYNRMLVPCGDGLPVEEGKTYDVTLDYWSAQPGCITVRDLPRWIDMRDGAEQKTVRSNGGRGHSGSQPSTLTLCLVRSEASCSRRWAGLGTVGMEEPS